MNTISLPPQVLSEFVQSLLDDLNNNRIAPDTALVASQQYPYLRAFIAEHSDEIARVLHEEGGLRNTLVRLLAAAGVLINKDLPQFQVEKPDAPLPPHEVVERARAFGRARSEVLTAIQGQRSFVHRLVQNWISQTRALTDKESQQLARKLQLQLEQGVFDATSPDEILARVGVGADAPQQELTVAAQRLAGFAALPNELVARLGSPRPDWFTSLAIQTISTTTLSPAAAAARASSLARTAEVLSRPLPKKAGAAGVGVFFRAFASTPTQNAFAAIADALLNQLSPLVRQEVIKATFSRAIEGVLAKTDVLAGRLGGNFVESNLFQLIVDGARKEFAQSTGSGARQARGAVEDIIGSLLRGPIMGPLVGSPREVIFSYFELLAIESRLPHDKKVVFPDHAPAVVALSLFTKKPSEQKRVAVSKNAVVGLTQKLPSWQVFYVMLLASGAPTVYSSFIAPTVTSMGELGGGAPVGTVGGGINAALGWVGRGLSGVAFGLGGGFLSMMFGGGLGAFFNRLRGSREPDHFLDDTPKLVAVFIVVAIVVLFVFPSFLNSPLTSRAAKNAALFVNSQRENQPDAFSGDGQTYPAPDYIDFASLGQLECLNTATAGIRGSIPFGSKEHAALEDVLVAHKELSLFSCPLRRQCEGGGINLSRYTAQNKDHSDWLGFAPSKNPGNIILYPGAFTSTNYPLSKILAHELMHQVQYFRGDMFIKYINEVDCGFLGIYRAGDETAEERFAELGAMYLEGNPDVRTFCGGNVFTFYQSMFSQCQ